MGTGGKYMTPVLGYWGEYNQPEQTSRVMVIKSEHLEGVLSYSFLFCGYPQQGETSIRSEGTGLKERRREYFLWGAIPFDRCAHQKVNGNPRLSATFSSSSFERPSTCSGEWPDPVLGSSLVPFGVGKPNTARGLPGIPLNR